MPKRQRSDDVASAKEDVAAIAQRVKKLEESKQMVLDRLVAVAGGTEDGALQRLTMRFAQAQLHLDQHKHELEQLTKMLQMMIEQLTVTAEAKKEALEKLETRLREIETYLQNAKSFVTTSVSEVFPGQQLPSGASISTGSTHAATETARVSGDLNVNAPGERANATNQPLEALEAEMHRLRNQLCDWRERLGREARDAVRDMQGVHDGASAPRDRALNGEPSIPGTSLPFSLMAPRGTVTLSEQIATDEQELERTRERQLQLSRRRRQALERQHQLTQQQAEQLTLQVTRNQEAQKELERQLRQLREQQQELKRQLQALQELEAEHVRQKTHQEEQRAGLERQLKRGWEQTHALERQLQPLREQEKALVRQLQERVRRRVTQVEARMRCASASHPGENLRQAAEVGNLQEVQRLLDSGIDVNYTDQFGYTPLLRALENDRLEVAALLLERGADVHAVNSEGSSALHLAAALERSGRAVKTLIRAGADVGARRLDGASPLHWAAQRCNAPAVRALQAAGARADAIGWVEQCKDRTPLEEAVLRKNT